MKSAPSRLSGWVMTAGSIGAMVLAASLVFVDTFRFERIIVPLAVAAFGPIAIDQIVSLTSVAPSRSRVPLLSQGIGSIVAWGIVVVPLGRPPGILTTVHSIVTGWSDILSATTPAAVNVGTMTVPFLLTWWTSVWCSRIASRSSRELTPIGPAAILAVIASLFGPHGSLPFRAWPLLFLTTSAAVAATRSAWSSKRLSRTGSWSNRTTRSLGGVGAAMVGALLAVAILGGTVVGVTRPPAPEGAFVMRRWWKPTGVPIEALDPFTLVSASVDPVTGARSIGRLKVVKRTETGPLRLRLSTASDFNGVGWTTRGHFLRLGDGLRPARTTGPTARLELILHVTEPSVLPFLPLPPIVHDIGPDDKGEFIINEQDAIITTISRNQRGKSLLAPGRYVIDGGELSTGKAPGVHTGSTGLDEPLSGVDSRVKTLARKWAGDGSPSRRAARLAQTLSGAREVEGFKPRVMDDAASDPSLARIQSLIGLGTPNDRATGSGTPAEFAGAFALLGRAAGLETRLVLGLVLPKATTGLDLQLRRTDLSIWPEVLIDEDGRPIWSPVNPVPALLSDRTPNEPDPLPSGPDIVSTDTRAPDSIPSRSESAMDRERARQRPVQPVGDRPTRVFSPRIRWERWLGLAIGIIVVCALLIFRRRQRTWRRTRGNPAARIAAGWAEIARMLAKRKIERATSMTPTETEKAIITAFGESTGSIARELHVRIDVGMFGPTEPTDEDATRVWSLIDELAELVGRRKPLA